MLRLYDFECRRCGVSGEKIVADNEQPFCGICNVPLWRLPPKIRVAMGAAGAHGYYDDNLETYIRTNKHRREVMRQRGVSDHGATPKPDGDAWV